MKQKEEIVELGIIKNNVLEAINKSEMIAAVWSIPDHLLRIEIRNMLVEELEKNN